MPVKKRNSNQVAEVDEIKEELAEAEEKKKEIVAEFIRNL